MSFDRQVEARGKLLGPGGHMRGGVLRGPFSTTNSMCSTNLAYDDGDGTRTVRRVYRSSKQSNNSVTGVVMATWRWQNFEVVKGRRGGKSRKATPQEELEWNKNPSARIVQGGEVVLNLR